MISMMTRFRRRKGYTLVEVVTAVILGSLMIAATLRWAAGISNVVTSSIRSGDNGQIVLAMSRLGDDVEAATHCDPNGRDAVLRELSPDLFRIVTDPQGSGTASVVTWRITQEGTIQRSVSSLDANCESPSPSSWSTIATGVDPATSWFHPVVAGVASADPADFLSCPVRSLSGCRNPTFTARLMRAGYDEIAESTFHVNVR